MVSVILGMIIIVCGWVFVLIWGIMGILCGLLVYCGLLVLLCLYLLLFLVGDGVTITKYKLGYKEAPILFWVYGV